MSVYFYITPLLQIETKGLENKTGDKADVIFHVKGQKLLGCLDFVLMKNKQVSGGKPATSSLSVRSAIQGCPGQPLDLPILQELLGIVIMNYQGITDVIGSAYTNGFFESEF